MGKCFVYLCTAIACLSSILLGYDVGIMSGAIVYMERDLALSKWREEVIVSSLSFFSIIGALLSGQIAASYGRKKTIAIAALLFFIGSIVMVITKLFAIIVLGRIILGIATGLGLVIAPLFTAELSPPRMRGKLGSLTEISINVGILSGYFVAWIFYFLHDDAAWRVMIGFGCVPSIILFLGMLIMPESPRWLIEHRRVDEAKQVLRRVHEEAGYTGSHSVESEIEAEVKEIQQIIKLEERDGKAGWNEILLPCIFKPSLALRKALIVGCGIAFFQQSTGVDAVTYYTPLTFRELGLDDQMVLLCTTFMGVSKLSFIVIAMMLLDRFGRRPMLLLSSIGMTVILCAMTFSFLMGRPAGFTIFLQCAYVSVFSLGWGPCCWLMISEIFPLEIRSRAMGVATCVNRVTAGVVALLFLSIQEAITPVGTWALFAVVSALSIWFVYRLVPETKNKSLEEITKSLVKGIRQSVPDTEEVFSSDMEIEMDGRHL